MKKISNAESLAVAQEAGSIVGTGIDRARLVAGLIDSKSRVLDVGFGLAPLPNLLKDCAWVGVDSNKHFVARAKREGLNAYLGTADSVWSAFDREFDVVVLMNLLEHVDSDVFALREAHRVLVKGGKVVGTVPYAVNLKKLYYENVHSALLDEHAGDDLRCYGLNELVYLLRKVGFKRKNIKVSRICTHLPLLHLKSGLPFLAVELLFEARK